MSLWLMVIHKLLLAISKFCQVKIFYKTLFNKFFREGFSFFFWWIPTVLFIDSRNSLWISSYFPNTNMFYFLWLLTYIIKLHDPRWMKTIHELVQHCKFQLSMIFLGQILFQFFFFKFCRKRKLLVKNVKRSQV